MNELDDKIREALRNEDADLFDDFGGELSMFAMVIETFRGKHRWLVMISIVWSLIFLVLGVLAAVKFFNATDERDLLMWAGASLICWSAVSMLKIWFWMELNKNAVTREIKRLELQIAKLASRIKD